MSTPAVLGDVKHSDPSRSFVSKTARSVAGMRAKETEKGDAALVVDPFAKLLAGPEDGSWLDTLPESSREFLVDMLAVRTKHIDDFLTRQAGAGTAQLVIVGSGLDTRSYRLAPLTGFPVYELDFPEVHAFKTGKLSGVSAPLAALSSVGVDLSQPSWPSALISAGFDTTKPSIWLLEGLIGCG